jgi:hypothetical protein
MNRFLSLPFAAWLILCACGDKKGSAPAVAFTKIDSLTDVYLNLQDSMLYCWNMMIQDDNQKHNAMKILVHELHVAQQLDPEAYTSFNYRMEQLLRIRYTPKTMMNGDVVEEYDFASNSLVSELVAVSEAFPAYAYNTVLRDLVEQIRLAEQRVAGHRDSYDEYARRYNQFLEENAAYLSELNQTGSFDKKPLFHMAAEE